MLHFKPPPGDLEPEVRGHDTLGLPSVAQEAELLGGDRRFLKPLADALVQHRLLTRGAGTLEVAHEALLRRKPVSEWGAKVYADLCSIVGTGRRNGRNALAAIRDALAALPAPAAA